MHCIRLFVVLLLLGVLTSPARAEAPQWTADPAHTGIYFDIRHIFATTRGHFDDYAIDIRFDPDDLAGSRCRFSVQTKSIDTNIRKRDTHLRSDDFFAAGNYPEMTFVSSAIRHTGGPSYEVTGELTIKDVTRTIAVPVIFHGVAPNPFDDKKRVAGLDARFTIDRLAYNVGTGKFYELGVVGKEVNILITVEAMR